MNDCFQNPTTESGGPGARLREMLVPTRMRHALGRFATWCSGGIEGEEIATCCSVVSSNTDVLQLVEFHPNSLVRDVVASLRPAIGRHIQIDLSLGNNIGLLRADLGQMRRLLTQLCRNAGDAMPSGGLLLIKTKDIAVSEVGRDRYPGLQFGRYLSLVVADTRCFNSRSKGRSIGSFFARREISIEAELEAVFTIVRQSNGTCSLHHETNIGRIVTIHLPVTDRPSSVCQSTCLVEQENEREAPDGIARSTG